MAKSGMTEKLAVAAGTVSLAAVPATADAAAVHVNQSVSIGFADLPGAAPTEFTYVPWDIDGQNGPDFFLGVNRLSIIFGYPGGSVIQVRQGGIAINNRTAIGAIGNGLSIAGTATLGELAQLASSNYVGPALPAGYAFGTSNKVALYTNVFNIFTPLGGGSSNSAVVQAGNLGFGANAIAFSFDIGGNTHYGTAKMILRRGPEPRLEIDGWVYEDQAGAAVHVDEVPVPSAGMAALTLLGLGAAGLRHQRKRKEQKMA